MNVTEFPDTLAWVAAYLADKLEANGYPDAYVSDKYRGDPIEVWLQRDGGSVLDVRREAARIRVNVFHDGETATAVDALAQRVSACLRQAPGALGPVLVVRLIAGPTPVPDIRPRRYLLFDLIVVGSTAELV